MIDPAPKTDQPTPPDLDSGALDQDPFGHASGRRGPARAAGPWLTYEQAAAYTGWSVGHLRNLVSAGQIPVYGHPRSRRFRRDMVDLYLTDRDVAMRLFHQERGNTHGR